MKELARYMAYERAGLIQDRKFFDNHILIITKSGNQIEIPLSKELRELILEE